MPRKDGIGPWGRGEMSGSGLGICRNMSKPMPYHVGRFDCGNSFRRNKCLRYGEAITQKDLLIEQKRFFENRIEVISKQLENL